MKSELAAVAERLRTVARDVDARLHTRGLRERVVAVVRLNRGKIGCALASDIHFFGCHGNAQLPGSEHVRRGGR